jgi:hypothetical protein
MADTQPFPAFFEACIANKDKVAQVKRDLPNLNLAAQHPSPQFIQPLAVLAARKGHAQILRFCLDRGAVFDWNLERPVYFGRRADSPAMDEILFAEKRKVRWEMCERHECGWSGEQIQMWFGDVGW